MAKLGEHGARFACAIRYSAGFALHVGGGMRARGAAGVMLRMGYRFDMAAANAESAL